MKEGTLTPADLARVQIFSSWNKRQLTKLAQKTVVRLCHEHERIYAAHAINSFLIIVRGGSLEKIMTTDDLAVPFNALTQGTTWGSESIISPGTKYPYDV